MSDGTEYMEDGILSTSAPPTGFYNVAKKKKQKKPRKPLSPLAKMTILAGLVVLAVTGVTLGITRPWEPPPPLSCLKDTLRSDILWILDESGSLSTNDFRNVKQSIVDFSRNFTFGPKQTRFGAFSFSTGNPATRPDFNEFINFQTDFAPWEDKMVIDPFGMPFQGGQTNVAAAFDYARDVFFQNPANQRAKIDNRFVIFVGDGLSTLPYCYNKTGYPGKNQCPGHPDCDGNVPEGFDQKGKNCTNPYWPVFNDVAGRYALAQLRAQVDFNFYFMAIENEGGSTVADLFGNFTTNPFGLYKTGDRLFVTSLGDLQYDMANIFSLDCSVKVEV